MTIIKIFLTIRTKYNATHERTFPCLKILKICLGTSSSQERSSSLVVL